MIFAIGKPGEPVRIFVDVPNLESLVVNIEVDEDAVGVPEIGDYVISGDGTSVEPRMPSLAEVQANAWSAVKVRRRRAEQAGCSTPYGFVQTDTDARARIATYAASAPLTGWSVSWKMADNSVVALNGEAIRTLNLAVMDHLSACHDNAQRLRDEIDAASSAEGVAVIDIDAGWPGVQA